VELFDQGYPQGAQTFPIIQSGRPSISRGTAEPFRPAASRGQQPLGGHTAIDKSKPQAADQPERRDVGPEQPIEAVRQHGQLNRVCTTPTLIALKLGLHSRIDAKTDGIDNDLGQCGHILEPKIEPLPGQWMYPVGCITD
jgi:hypothetical protein